MKYDKVSRRMFLQGSGGALLAIPFLPSLLPRTAWAQTAPAPKRFITLFNNLDYGHNGNWLPGSAGNLANIPQPNRVIPAANGEREVRWQPLREFAPTNSSVLAPIWGSALSPYLESINIMRSIDFSERRAHDTSKLLGGLGSIDDGNGKLLKIPSIDQVISQKLGYVQPVVVAGQLGYDQVSLATAPGNIVVHGTSFGYGLQEIYEGIFRHGTYPDVTTPANMNRRDILSRVLGDFSRIINSKNISALDKQTLSNAMDKMSDVQRGLSSIYAAQCSYKGISIPVNSNVGTACTDSNHGKVFADIITAAFMCDAARVMTIGTDMFSGAVDDVLGGDDIHQKISHTPWRPVGGGRVAWQSMADRHAYTVRCFIAPLLQNLSSAMDATNGRSLLYNSLIYNTVECGQVHGWASQPVLLAGNAGGSLSTGNYIDYADRGRGASFDGCDLGLVTAEGNVPFTTTPGDPRFTNNWRGVLYPRLLTTILQAFGLQPQDYENPAVGAQLCNRTDIGAQNANLTSIGGYGYPFAWDTTITNNGGIQETLRLLANYDLKQMRYKLPMP